MTILPECDTIAAIATPPGKGGIAVIKVSGPDAAAIARGIFSSSVDPASHERRMVYGRIMDGTECIDEALCCIMKAPHSSTGEDVAEIQVHGGSAVAETILSLLLARGARISAPGEFTRRAFLNGRIDLAQAEGILEIISAENREHRRIAGQLLEGVFSERIRSLTNSLTETLMLLEASIDFGEDTADSADRVRVWTLLASIAQELEGMVDSRRTVERIRNGVQIVLAGNVNVGKSCLFNALLGKKRALVHETPGTTRDWLESSLEIDGIPITLIDTAGFRDTTSEIERSGIAETNRLVASADIVIYLHDTLSSIPERSLIREKEHTVLHVLSKSDLLGELTVPERVIAVSSINGTGLAILRNTIAGCARDMIRAGATSPAVLVARHARELNGALEHIRTALDGIETLTEDILSCEVRAATNHLEAILGKSIGIDVLDEIFSHFCIGK